MAVEPPSPSPSSSSPSPSSPAATGFSCTDLAELTQVVTTALRGASSRDWSVPAGTLTWSCARTADHIVDTLLAPALFLASRKQDDYPAFGPSTMGPDAATP